MNLAILPPKFVTHISTVLILNIKTVDICNTCFPQSIRFECIHVYHVTKLTICHINNIHNYNKRHTIYNLQEGYADV